MHALIHNQLCSPKFANMIRFAWGDSGYMKKVNSFQNVLEICFADVDRECDEEMCDNICFICCSHCGAHYCMDHFFSQTHYHLMLL
jgi:Tc5 transposase C-terminal domain